MTVRNVIEVFEDEKEVEKKKSKNNIVKNDRSIGKRELGNGSNY